VEKNRKKNREGLEKGDRESIDCLLVRLERKGRGPLFPVVGGDYQAGARENQKKGEDHAQPFSDVF